MRAGPRDARDVEGHRCVLQHREVADVDDVSQVCGVCRRLRIGLRPTTCRSFFRRRRFSTASGFASRLPYSEDFFGRDRWCSSFNGLIRVFPCPPLPMRTRYRQSPARPRSHSHAPHELSARRRCGSALAFQLEPQKFVQVYSLFALRSPSMQGLLRLQVDWQSPSSSCGAMLLNHGQHKIGSLFVRLRAFG